jgi:hypothetical protein
MKEITSRNTPDENVVQTERKEEDSSDDGSEDSMHDISVHVYSLVNFSYLQKDNKHILEGDSEYTEAHSPKIPSSDELNLDTALDTASEGLESFLDIDFQGNGPTLSKEDLTELVELTQMFSKDEILKCRFSCLKELLDMGYSAVELRDALHFAHFRGPIKADVQKNEVSEDNFFQNLLASSNKEVRDFNLSIELHFGLRRVAMCFSKSAVIEDRDRLQPVSELDIGVSSVDSLSRYSNQAIITLHFDNTVVSGHVESSKDLMVNLSLSSIVMYGDKGALLLRCGLEPGPSNITDDFQSHSSKKASKTSQKSTKALQLQCQWCESICSDSNNISFVPHTVLEVTLDCIELFAHRESLSGIMDAVLCVLEIPLFSAPAFDHLVQDVIGTEMSILSLREKCNQAILNKKRGNDKDHDRTQITKTSINLTVLGFFIEIQEKASELDVVIGFEKFDFRGGNFLHHTVPDGARGIYKRGALDGSDLMESNFNTLALSIACHQVSPFVIFVEELQIGLKGRTYQHSIMSVPWNFGAVVSPCLFSTNPHYPDVRLDVFSSPLNLAFSSKDLVTIIDAYQDLYVVFNFNNSGKPTTENSTFIQQDEIVSGRQKNQIPRLEVLSPLCSLALKFQIEEVLLELLPEKEDDNLDVIKSLLTKFSNGTIKRSSSSRTFRTLSMFTLQRMRHMGIAVDTAKDLLLRFRNTILRAKHLSGAKGSKSSRRTSRSRNSLSPTRSVRYEGFESSSGSMPNTPASITTPEHDSRSQKSTPCLNQEPKIDTIIDQFCDEMVDILKMRGNQSKKKNSVCHIQLSEMMFVQSIYTYDSQFSLTIREVVLSDADFYPVLRLRDADDIDPWEVPSTLYEEVGLDDPSTFVTPDRPTRNAASSSMKKSNPRERKMDSWSQRTRESGKALKSLGAIYLSSQFNDKKTHIRSGGLPLKALYSNGSWVNDPVSSTKLILGHVNCILSPSGIFKQAQVMIPALTRITDKMRDLGTENMDGGSTVPRSSMKDSHTPHYHDETNGGEDLMYEKSVGDSAKKEDLSIGPTENKVLAQFSVRVCSLTLVVSLNDALLAEVFAKAIVMDTNDQIGFEVKIGTLEMYDLSQAASMYPIVLWTRQRSTLKKPKVALSSFFHADRSAKKKSQEGRTSVHFDRLDLNTPVFTLALKPSGHAHETPTSELIMHINGLRNVLCFRFIWEMTELLSGKFISPLLEILNPIWYASTKVADFGATIGATEEGAVLSESNLQLDSPSEEAITRKSSMSLDFHSPRSSATSCSSGRTSFFGRNIDFEDSSDSLSGDKNVYDDDMKSLLSDSSDGKRVENASDKFTRTVIYKIVWSDVEILIPRNSNSRDLSAFSVGGGFLRSDNISSRWWAPTSSVEFDHPGDHLYFDIDTNSWKVSHSDGKSSEPFLSPPQDSMPWVRLAIQLDDVDIFSSIAGPFRGRDDRARCTGVDSTRKINDIVDGSPVYKLNTLARWDQNWRKLSPDKFNLLILIDFPTDPTMFMHTMIGETDRRSTLKLDCRMSEFCNLNAVYYDNFCEKMQFFLESGTAEEAKIPVKGPEVSFELPPYGSDAYSEYLGTISPSLQFLLVHSCLHLIGHMDYDYWLKAFKPESYELMFNDITKIPSYSQDNWSGQSTPIVDVSLRWNIVHIDMDDDVMRCFIASGEAKAKDIREPKRVIDTAAFSALPDFVRTPGRKVLSKMVQPGSEVTFGLKFGPDARDDLKLVEVPMKLNYISQLASNINTLVIAVKSGKINFSNLDLVYLSSDLFSNFYTTCNMGNRFTDEYYEEIEGLTGLQLPYRALDIHIYAIRPQATVFEDPSKEGSPALVLGTQQGIYYRQSWDTVDSRSYQILTTELYIDMLQALNGPCVTELDLVEVINIGERVFAHGLNLSFIQNYYALLKQTDIVLDTFSSESAQIGPSVSTNGLSKLVTEKYLERYGQWVGLGTTLEAHPITLNQPRCIKPLVAGHRGFTSQPLAIVSSYEDTLRLVKYVDNFLDGKLSGKPPPGRLPLAPAPSLPVDDSVEDEEDEESSFIVLRAGGLKVTLIDHILGLHLPFLQIYVDSVELTRDTSAVHASDTIDNTLRNQKASRIPLPSDESVRAVLKSNSEEDAFTLSRESTQETATTSNSKTKDKSSESNEGQKAISSILMMAVRSTLWIDYFNHTLKCWEPMLEPLCLTFLQDSCPSRGAGMNIEMHSLFHVNLSGALLRNLNEINRVMKDIKTAKLTEEVASANDDFETERRAIATPRTSSFLNRSVHRRTASAAFSAPRHVKTSNLSLNARVGFSIFNLTGQPLRYLHMHDEVDHHITVRYLSSGNRGRLNFLASKTLIRNRAVVEEKFEDTRVQNDGHQSMSRDVNIGNLIALQICGCKWRLNVQADHLGINFERLSSVSGLIEPTSLRASLPSNVLDSLQLRTEVKQMSGGRVLILSSAFSIRNNTNHSLRLLMNHAAGQNDQKYRAESLNMVPHVLEKGKKLSIPLALPRESLTRDPNSLGYLWLQPEDMTQTLKELGTNNHYIQPSFVRFSSEPISLMDVVNGKGYLQNNIKVDDRSNMRSSFSAGPTLSCLVDAKRYGTISEGDGVKRFGTINDDVVRDTPQYINSLRLPSLNYCVELKKDSVAGIKNKRKKKRNSKKGEEGPFSYSLVIHPPLVLENLLPCGAIFELRNPQSNISLFRSWVEAGAQLPIFTVSLDVPLVLFVTLRYCHSQDGKLVHKPTTQNRRTEKLSNFITGVFFEGEIDENSFITMIDSASQKVRLQLKNTLGDGGQRSLTLYAPYWIVNTSQYTVRIRSEGSDNLPAGTVTDQVDGSRQIQHELFNTNSKADTDDDVIHEQIMRKNWARDVSNDSLPPISAMKRTSSTGAKENSRVEDSTVYPGNPGPVHRTRPTLQSDESLLHYVGKSLPFDDARNLAYIFNHKENYLGSSSRKSIEIQLENSKWSAPISIDSIAINQYVSVHHFDELADSSTSTYNTGLLEYGVHEVGFRVEKGPGRLSKYTNIVRFTPRFMCMNKLPVPIALVQPSLINTTGGSYVPKSMVVAQNNLRPFFLPHHFGERKISVLLAGQWHKSKPISIDDVVMETQNVKKRIDLANLRHVSTRNSHQFEVIIPPMSELGVWFETDWARENIVVRNVKKGEFASEETDIQPGDVLLEINGIRFSGQDFERALILLKEKLNDAGCNLLFRTNEERLKLIRDKAKKKLWKSSFMLPDTFVSDTTLDHLVGADDPWKIPLKLEVSAIGTCSFLVAKLPGSDVTADYRVENRSTSVIIYFKQKDESSRWHALNPGCSCPYVWDSPSGSHVLIVKAGMNILSPSDQIESDGKRSRHTREDGGFLSLPFDEIGICDGFVPLPTGGRLAGIVDSEGATKVLKIGSSDTFIKDELQYANIFATSQIHLLKDALSQLKNPNENCSSDDDHSDTTEDGGPPEAHSRHLMNVISVRSSKRFGVTDEEKMYHLAAIQGAEGRVHSVITECLDAIKDEQTKLFLSFANSRGYELELSDRDIENYLDYLNGHLVSRSHPLSHRVLHSFAPSISVLGRHMTVANKCQIEIFEGREIKPINSSGIEDIYCLIYLKFLTKEKTGANSVPENIPREQKQSFSTTLCEGTTSPIWDLQRFILHIPEDALQRPKKYAIVVKCMGKSRFGFDHVLGKTHCSLTNVVLRSEKELEGWFPLTRNIIQTGLEVEKGFVGSLKVRMKWVHSAAGVLEHSRHTIKRRISTLEKLHVRQRMILRGLMGSQFNLQNPFGASAESFNPRKSSRIRMRRRLGDSTISKGSTLPSSDAFDADAFRFFIDPPINFISRGNQITTAGELFHQSFTREARRAFLSTHLGSGKLEITAMRALYIPESRYSRFVSITYADTKYESYSVPASSKSIWVEDSLGGSETVDNKKTKKKKKKIATFHIPIDTTDIRGDINLQIVGNSFPNQTDLAQTDLKLFPLLEAICMLDSGYYYDRWFALDFKNAESKKLSQQVGELREYSERDSSDVFDNVMNKACIRLRMRWVPDKSEAQVTDKGRNYLRLHVPRMSCSLIDSVMVREVMFIRLDYIDVRLYETELISDSILVVWNFQIHNQLFSPVSPVIMSPAYKGSTEPLVKARALQNKRTSHQNLVSFEVLLCIFQELDLRIEQTFVKATWKLISNWLRELSRSSGSQFIEEELPNYVGGFKSTPTSSPLDQSKEQKPTKTLVISDGSTSDGPKATGSVILTDSDFRKSKAVASHRVSKAISSDSGLPPTNLRFSKRETISVFEKGESTNNLSVMSDDTNAMTSQFDADFTNNEDKSNIYIEKMLIGPLKINISFIMTSELGGNSSREFGTHDRSRTYNSFISQIGEVALGVTSTISDAPIRISGMDRKHVFKTIAELTSTLQEHYKGAVLGQLYRIVGSLDLVGNPVGLVSSLGTGVRDLFFEPANAIMKSPTDIREIGKGLFRGGFSIVSNTADGVIGTATVFTKAISQSMALMSMDEDFISTRDALARKPIGAHNLISRPVRDLLNGFFCGAVGVIKEPYTLTKRFGYKGLLGGIVSGIFGVALKPTIGIMDAFVHAGDAFRGYSLLLSRKGKDSTHRTRLIGMFGPDGRLLPYNPTLALGSYALQLLLSLSQSDAREALRAQQKNNEDQGTGESAVLEGEIPGSYRRKVGWGKGTEIMSPRKSQSKLSRTGSSSTLLTEREDNMIIGREYVIFCTVINKEQEGKGRKRENWHSTVIAITDKNIYVVHYRGNFRKGSEEFEVLFTCEIDNLDTPELTGGGSCLTLRYNKTAGSTKAGETDGKGAAKNVLRRGINSIHSTHMFSQHNDSAFEYGAYIINAPYSERESLLRTYNCIHTLSNDFDELLPLHNEQIDEDWRGKSMGILKVGSFQFTHDIKGFNFESILTNRKKTVQKLESCGWIVEEENHNIQEVADYSIMHYLPPFIEKHVSESIRSHAYIAEIDNLFCNIEDGPQLEGSDSHYMDLKTGVIDYPTFQKLMEEHKRASKGNDSQSIDSDSSSRDGTKDQNRSKGTTYTKMMAFLGSSKPPRERENNTQKVLGTVVPHLTSESVVSHHRRRFQRKSGSDLNVNISEREGGMKSRRSIVDRMMNFMGRNNDLQNEADASPEVHSHKIYENAADITGKIGELPHDVQMDQRKQLVEHEERRNSTPSLVPFPDSLPLSFSSQGNDRANEGHRLSQGIFPAVENNSLTDSFESGSQAHDPLQKLEGLTSKENIESSESQESDERFQSPLTFSAIGGDTSVIGADPSALNRLEGLDTFIRADFMSSPTTENEFTNPLSSIKRTNGRKHVVQSENNTERLNLAESDLMDSAVSGSNSATNGKKSTTFRTITGSSNKE